MLRLLLGPDWTENRDEILRRIAADVREKKSGRILMVPELISHDMERRLCYAAGDTSSRYAEVLSFTRLVNRVSESSGVAPQACLDNGGRLVAMSAGARQLHSKLKAYASVESRPEFLMELLDAIDEFKRCCISPYDLKTASEQTEGSLAQKLEELALLFEAYEAVCQRGKRDPRDQMNWLLEQLEDGDFAEKHVFYIDGFPDFTRQHMAILQHLILHSQMVTISLNCDRPGTQVLAFEKAGNTAMELIQCAKQAGVQTEIVHISGKNNTFASLRGSLFQGAVQYNPELDGRLLLRRAETIYDECRGAADRIVNLIRGGVRYRDISVVCSDVGQYKDALRFIFKQYNIPLYLSGTEDILSKTTVSSVMAALDAALGGFEREAVLRFLKSPLSSMSVDMCDLIENYAVIWNVRGARWTGEWDWHPDGLDGIWDDSSRARLLAMNEARTIAIEPLKRLQKGFRSAKTLKEQVVALTSFLDELQYAQRLEAMARQMDRTGDNRSSQILNQLWDILLSALEQLYDALGDTVWDDDTFVRLLKLLLSQYDVGTIPPVLDAVIAGPVSAMRCHQSSHLLVLGAQEGSFPGYAGSKGVLTDQERVALRQLGVPLTGGSLEGLQAEFAEIYGVFCGACESIQVSCPSGQTSYLYRRLAEMAGGDCEFPISPGPAVTNPQEAGGLLAAMGRKEEADALGLSFIYDDICCRSEHTLGTVSAEQIGKLYGKRLRLSASQVDKHADCRLAYFLKYGLRANERKEATVDPAEFGTYVHYVLEHTAKHVKELGGFHEVSADDTMEIAMQYSAQYQQERFSQLDSERAKYLFERNIQELRMVVEELWRELHVSEFEPVDFEVSFGDGMDMPAIEVEDAALQAQLRGFVDRVDSWCFGRTNYFRVVDYKTGKKDFDYCDVYNGLGLQMLLYMFALEQGGDALLGEAPVSAGVQYFPARCPVIRSDGRMSEDVVDEQRGKGMRRKGLLLANEDVLRAMEPEGAPKRLNAGIKKDGSFTGDVADHEQLKLLKGYVFKHLQKMVNEIASGCVTPNPYTRGSSHNACTYCAFKAVCNYTTVSERRNYAAMTAEQFWQGIRKEMENDG